MDEISSYTIWEYLKNGKDIKKLLSNSPEESRDWIKRRFGNIKYNFFYLQLYCNKIHEYFKYGGYFEDVDKKTRDEFLEHVTNNYEEYLHPILLSIWDGDKTKFNDLTWEQVKPKFDKPNI